jgi:hypothetical protein
MAVAVLDLYVFVEDGQVPQAQAVKHPIQEQQGPMVQLVQQEMQPIQAQLVQKVLPVLLD